MTKQELASLLNVSRNTLNNWEKEKPDLVRLINQGLVLDDQIEEAERNLNKLKALKEKANSNKFQLK